MEARFITTDGHRWEAQECNDLAELLDPRLVLAKPLDGKLSARITDEYVWVVSGTIVACWWED